jgi:hypothetical protein
VKKLAAHAPEKLTPAFRAFQQQQAAGAALHTRALLETPHDIYIVLKRDPNTSGSNSSSSGSSSVPGKAAGTATSGGEQRYKIAGRSDIILAHSASSSTAGSSSSTDSSGSNDGPAYRHLLELKCPIGLKEDVEQMWVNQALAYALLSDRHIHQISVVDMHAGVLYTWTPVPLAATSATGQGGSEGAPGAATAAAGAGGRHQALEDVPGAFVWPWAPISRQHRLTAMYNVAKEYKWRDERLRRALAGQVISKAEAADRTDGVA